MEDPFDFDFDVPSTKLAKGDAIDISCNVDEWFEIECQTGLEAVAQHTRNRKRDENPSPKKKQKTNMPEGPRRTPRFGHSASQPALDSLKEAARKDKRVASVKNVLQSKFKSSEELELEKAAMMREKLAATRKKNEHGYKVALASGPVLEKRSAKPATMPEGFHFQSDKRIRGLPERVPKSKVQESKRQNGSSKSTAGKVKTSTTHLTCPQPFNLSEAKSSKSTVPAAGQYKSVAEKVYQYHNRTPDRFKSKTEAIKNKSKSVSHLPQLTVAKTPKLTTKGRSRPTHTISRAEQEEQEFIEENKKQFKANAVNQKILAVPNVGVHKVAPKPLTVPEEFDFHKTAPSHTQPEEEKVEAFHATQLNPRILEGPIGVKPVERPALTIPQSPAFNTRHRVRQIVQEPQQEVAPAPTKHHHVPHVGVPFRPKLERTCTVPQPFAVDQRSKQMLKHKEQKIAEILEEEKRQREFVAQLLPSDSPDALPLKQTKPATEPVPFNLAVEERGHRYQEFRQKQLEEETQQVRAQAEFKARPLKELKGPFLPQRSDKPLTEFDNFTLNTDSRATERERYNQFLKEHESKVTALMKQVEDTKQQEEAVAVAKLRHEMVHRATGIKRYNSVLVNPSTKPLTLPQSPNLRTQKKFRRNEEEN